MKFDFTERQISNSSKAKKISFRTLKTKFQKMNFDEEYQLDQIINEN